MWSREELKTRAKSVLKISYWKAFLVSIVIAIAGGSNNGSRLNYNFNGRSNSGNFRNNYRSIINFNGDIFQHWMTLVFGISLLVILVAIAFRIFLGYLFEVGGRRYFIHAAQNKVDMNNLGYGFNKDRYKNIVVTMLWRGILNFLWFLLLIIPGIVKSYAYKMVPYILADNPNIGYSRAIELSERMTDGQKFDMFILDLSFIGWYLLGTIALGIGVLFVAPYDNATHAELYLVLRQNAIDRGLTSYEELLIENTVTE